MKWRVFGPHKPVPEKKCPGGHEIVYTADIDLYWCPVCGVCVQRLIALPKEEREEGDA